MKRPWRSHLRQESAFRCLHCRNLVITDPAFSGVQNRNHCPYCLASRHLDLYRAGDRLSACKQAMQAVGLTLKKTHKRYDYGVGGELMLIHHCTGCGRLSINRIAADDDPQAIYAVFRASLQTDPALAGLLGDEPVRALTELEAGIVQARLFGWQSEAVFA